MHKIFHCVFSTYKRKQVLTDEIGRHLAVIFHKISNKKGFEVISLSILVDHVHVLIKKNASDNNEYIMKMIKGISSREIFKLYPSNRFEFRKLWGRGYRAFEIKDENQLRQTISYIENQKINGLDKRIAGSREVHSQASVEAGKPRRSVSGRQDTKGTGNREVYSQVSVANLQSRMPRHSVSGCLGAKGAGSREVHSQASV